MKIIPLHYILLLNCYSYIYCYCYSYFTLLLSKVGGKTVGALNEGFNNITTSVGTAFSSIGDNIKKAVAQKAPELIVQEQLDFYNEQNLPKFLELFHDKVIVLMHLHLV